MKIVALNSIVTAEKKGQVTHPPGAQLDLPDDEAAALIEAGAARPLEQPPLAHES